MGVAELVDAAGSGPAGRKSREGSNPSPHNKKMTEEPLKIIPLGGLEEVGRNMTLFEYKGKILILDMGLMFPDCLLYTSPSPRDLSTSRMPSSA